MFVPIPVRPRACILHADLDSFYASVEQRDDPALRGRPVIVGGGVVLAASYEAKAFGVRTPMGSGMVAQLKAGRADRAVRADTIAQATVSSLEERIAGAKRGERIVLPAGTYRIDREVQVAVPLVPA